jgi:hypothetical protein
MTIRDKEEAERQKKAAQTQVVEQEKEQPTITRTNAKTTSAAKRSANTTATAPKNSGTIININKGSTNEPDPVPDPLIPICTASIKDGIYRFRGKGKDTYISTGIFEENGKQAYMHTSLENSFPKSQRFCVKRNSDCFYSVRTCMENYAWDETKHDVDGDGNPTAILTKHEHHGDHQQQFNFIQKGNNYYEIRGRHSGHCIDIDGDSGSDGAPLKIWWCKDDSENYKDAQLFLAESASPITCACSI